MTECRETAFDFEKPLAFFREIAKIPRGSTHCEAIADYLVSFAETRGLSYERDGFCNVLIRKPASSGYEAKDPVVLQGHTDMVAVKSADCRKDLNKDGLDLLIEGDELFAEGTSLGGDDGFFVACALAILDDRALPHPPIEALFTSDEEIGLIGATGFDTGKLKGKTLINLDSDEEGVFTFGCAGGVRCDMEFSGKKAPAEGRVFNVRLSGLCGGHSGIEIHKGRANAIVALAKMILSLREFRLVSMTGGSADNAIPSSAEATLILHDDPTESLKKSFELLTNAYKTSESGMKIEICEQDKDSLAFDATVSRSVVNFIAETPFGVYEMCEEPKGLVKTSENPGVVSTSDDSLSLTVSVRSSVGAQKDKLVAMLKKRTEDLGGLFSTRGDYPAWEYKDESPIRDAACRVYSSLYGKQPVCTVVHAGLECGIFDSKIEGLDAISLGPDMKDIHSENERLSLSSSARVYSFLLALLKSL